MHARVSMWIGDYGLRYCSLVHVGDPLGRVSSSVLHRRSPSPFHLIWYRYSGKRLCQINQTTTTASLLTLLRFTASVVTSPSAGLCGPDLDIPPASLELALVIPEL